MEDLPGIDQLNQLRIQAFDLSERTTRAGYRTARRRVHRWRDRGFLIAQCSVAAGLAWLCATSLLQHKVPMFAPIAAIVVLNVTYGNRLRRGVEVAIGVAVGVFVGDLFATLFGFGVWQIMLVSLTAMSIATLVGAGALMMIQAAVQSIVVITLMPEPGAALDRWLDALVGCLIALAIATIAPSTPLRKPGLLAAQLLNDMAGTLHAAATALRDRDSAAADQVLERASAADKQLQALQDAAAEGLAVVELTPFHHGRKLNSAQAYADLIGPLGRASHNLRVLARRSLVALLRDEQVPASYLDLVDQVGDQAKQMAGDLGDHKLPVSARAGLTAVAQDTAGLEIAGGINSIVILAQSRSILVDLMELTGLDYVEARELVPDVH